MISFKKYFSHHFKETLMRTVVLTVLALLLAISFLEFHRSTETNYYSHYDHEEPYKAFTYVYGNIAVLGVIAAISATVIPILELIGFKNRRNMDALLVLPISRTKMAFAHYLNGIIELLLVNGACFLLATVMMIPYADVYPIWAMILFFGLLMLACIALYSLFFFVFMQGNTIADGVIFMILYSVVGMLIALAVNNFAYHALDIRNIDDYIECFTPYSPIVFLTSYFEPFITPSMRYDALIDTSNIIIFSQATLVKWETEYTVSLVIWCVLGALSAVGYVYSFAKQRIERIGGVSSSPFGYMTLIPICAFSSLFSGISGITFGIIIMIAMIIGYIIYRRSIKLKIPDFICIGIFALALFTGISF